MALPFVQVQTKGNGASSGGSTLAITWTNNTKNGNTIFVVVGTGNFSFSIVSSITDSQNNIYTKIDSGSNTIDGEIWYARNIAGGTTPTITITFSGSGQDESAIAAEYSGPIISPLDKHVVSTGNSGTINTATTAVTNVETELVIVWGVLQNSSPAFVVGSGFAHLASNTGGVLSTAIEDKTVTVSGTQTGSITGTSSAWVGGVITITPGNKVVMSRLRPHTFSPGLAR